MTEMTMVEKAARALALKDSGGTRDIEDYEEHQQASFFDDARTVIEAMREPTSLMCNLATAAERKGWGAERFANAWRAAIDAALVEKQEGE